MSGPSLLPRDTGGGRPPTSRKITHVVVFTGAVPAQLYGGFWGVVGYGAVVAGVILLATLQGRGSALHGVLTRPRDGHQARRYILIPLVSTALGGFLSLLLVGPFAMVGYLVCGWGDAAGEWVGSRWGRHRYPSPTGGKEAHRRSLEGSLAVLCVGTLGGWSALRILGVPLPEGVGVAMACGLVGTLAEGISTHGTDNLTMQAFPSLTAWWMVG